MILSISYNTVRINCILKQVHKIPITTNHTQEIHHINKVGGNIITQKTDDCTGHLPKMTFCLLADKDLKNSTLLGYDGASLHCLIMSRFDYPVTQHHILNGVLSYTDTKTSKLTLQKSIYFNISKCSTHSRRGVIQEGEE